MDYHELAQKAADLKQNQGYNCCQAVTAVLADQTEMSEGQLNQIASGFAVGMGNMGATCGSLIGAAMIAGLKCGGKATVRYTKQISEKFEEMSGALTCAALKGMEDQDIFCPCEQCVQNAVLAYGEVFSEQDS